MKNKKIILAGGTGFIGQELRRYFGKENSIVVLTRQSGSAVNNRHRYSILGKEDLNNVRYIKWDGKTTGDWANELNGADLLINLAGKTVNCRYTEKNKKEIFDSRTDSVKALGKAIDQCLVPPALWINASSATIYRHATDRQQDEDNGEFHHDFSVQVCQLWEKTFF